MAGPRTYEYQGQTLTHRGTTQVVSVEGLDTLRRLLTPPDELIGEPWKVAITSLAQEGERRGKAAAPYLSGQTQRKIKGAVQKKAMPRWVAVRSRGAGAKSA